MGKFDGYLLCSDIDGTLVSKDAQISRENIDAISYFQSEGGRFTVATGRSAHYIEKFEFKVNAPVICVNGAAVYDLENEKLLSLNPLQAQYNDIMSEFFSNYSENIKNAEICGLDGSVLYEKQEIEGPDMFCKAIYDYDSLKLVFRFYEAEHSASARAYMNSLFSQRVDFVRAWPEGLEMLETKANKGHCVKMLKEQFLPDVKFTVGAGDFENDISLVRDSDIGYAVENAVTELKSYADRFAPSNFDSAIAFIIEDLEKNPAASF